MIDLTPFCLATPGHPLHVPWNAAGWRYATNRHIAVRVPTTDPDDDATGRPAMGDLRGWSDCPQADKPLPPAGEPVPAPCQDCEGTGRAVCKSCCGSVIAACPTCGQDRDCPACGGSGLGKDLCAVCHGKKVHGTMPGPVDLGIPGWQLDGRYHALIARLPNVLWTVAFNEGGKCCVAFRFDGGEGLLAMLK